MLEAIDPLYLVQVLRQYLVRTRRIPHSLVQWSSSPCHLLFRRRADAPTPIVRVWMAETLLDLPGVLLLQRLAIRRHGK